MHDSVFTQIIKGEVPATIIYEDELCIVMPSYKPINPGHLLVIPREQIANLWDVSDATYAHLNQVAKNMANLLRKTYDYVRIGSMVDGFGVPDHAHIHVFGLSEGLEPTIVHFVANQRLDTPEELAAVTAKLQAGL